MKLLIEDNVTGLRCDLCEGPSAMRLLDYAKSESEVLCSTCGMVRLFDGMVDCAGMANFVDAYLKVKDMLAKSPGTAQAAPSDLVM